MPLISSSVLFKYNTSELFKNSPQCLEVLFHAEQLSRRSEPKWSEGETAAASSIDSMDTTQEELALPDYLSRQWIMPRYSLCESKVIKASSYHMYI